MSSTLLFFFFFCDGFDRCYFLMKPVSTYVFRWSFKASPSFYKVRRKMRSGPHATVTHKRSAFKHPLFCTRHAKSWADGIHHMPSLEKTEGGGGKIKNRWLMLGLLLSSKCFEIKSKVGCSQVGSFSHHPRRLISKSHLIPNSFT